MNTDWHDASYGSGFSSFLLVLVSYAMALGVLSILAAYACGLRPTFSSLRRTCILTVVAKLARMIHPGVTPSRNGGSDAEMAPMAKRVAMPKARRASTGSVGAENEPLKSKQAEGDDDTAKGLLVTDDQAPAALSPIRFGGAAKARIRPARESSADLPTDEGQHEPKAASGCKATVPTQFSVTNDNAPTHRKAHPWEAPALVNDADDEVYL